MSKPDCRPLACPRRKAAGDYPKIVLGIAIMSILVTLFNRLLWRPLYVYAEDRLRLD